MLFFLYNKFKEFSIILLETIKNMKNTLKAFIIYVLYYFLRRIYKLRKLFLIFKFLIKILFLRANKNCTLRTVIKSIIKYVVISFEFMKQA